MAVDLPDRDYTAIMAVFKWSFGPGVHDGQSSRAVPFKHERAVGSTKGWKVLSCN